MGMHIRTHIRYSDFHAVAWLKPAQLGGFATWASQQALRGRMTFKLDGEWIEGGSWQAGEDYWINPGESVSCQITNMNWHDHDRRAIRIGAPIELLVTTKAGEHGPPQCVGLGRISARQDPELRHFLADAEAEVELVSPEQLATLPGRIVHLEFPWGRTWEGHFDLIRDTDREAYGASLTALWLCLYHVLGPWQANDRYPDVDDHFIIFADGARIGHGRVASRTGYKRHWTVCYPNGWLEGGGLQGESRLNR